MARKRAFTTFNLSFLDIMSCGFGAVILVFLIIDHSIEQESDRRNEDLLSEVNLIAEDVVSGQENMVRLRNTLSVVDLQIVEARGLAARITDEIVNYQSLLAALESEGVSSKSDLEQLQAEILRLQQELESLRVASDAENGLSARRFIGDGNRQYLTGLNLGGSNILILLDASASMLAPNIVNVIRMRNMDDSIKLKSAKWKRSVATVNWLTAQLPLSSRYQIMTFNTEAKTTIPGTEGSWLKVEDRDQLDRAVEALQKVVPAGGTSLETLFLDILDFSPLPDNIFLITDGLPTQGAARPRKPTIDAEDRLRLFERAVTQLPNNIPVNVILAPMEGDPMAASAFWLLAQQTGGAFMSPSKDWP
ncbi:MAG: hypothetical protein ACI9GW_002215 [Halieaceae bacterium]|jgi:hypothetical protein